MGPAAFRIRAGAWADAGGPRTDHRHGWTIPVGRMERRRKEGAVESDDPREKTGRDRNETRKSAEADRVESDETMETYSLEALDEAEEELRREWEAGDMVDTAHTDGSTSNPHQAQEQGLVYDPPSDPPVLAQR